MNRRIVMLFAVGALALAGCENFSRTPAKALIATCDAYGEALLALAGYADTMSSARRVRVTEVRQYVHPFCAKDQPLPLDPNTAVSYIINPVIELTRLLTDLGGPAITVEN